MKKTRCSVGTDQTKEARPETWSSLSWIRGQNAAQATCVSLCYAWILSRPMCQATDFTHHVIYRRLLQMEMVLPELQPMLVPDPRQATDVASEKHCSFRLNRTEWLSRNSTGSDGGEALRTSALDNGSLEREHVRIWCNTY